MVVGRNVIYASTRGDAPPEPTITAGKSIPSDQKRQVDAFWRFVARYRDRRDRAGSAIRQTVPRNIASLPHRIAPIRIMSNPRPVSGPTVSLWIPAGGTTRKNGLINARRNRNLRPRNPQAINYPIKNREAQVVKKAKRTAARRRRSRGQAAISSVALS